MLAVLLSGCGGGASPAQEFLTRGTSGTQEVSASRGIASGGTLFVSLEKELGMHCTVNWEVLGEEVTQAQVVMMLETFRMYMEDALDGLTTEEAGEGNLDDFVAGTVQKAVEQLDSDQISVEAETAGYERTEAS